MMMILKITMSLSAVMMMVTLVMIVHLEPMIQKAQTEPMMVVMAGTMMLMVSVMLVMEMMIMMAP